MLNNLALCFDIKFNHEIDLGEEELIVPGGYEMIFNDKSIQFDFLNYIGNINNDDPTIFHCEVEHLDFKNFEDVRNLTIDDLLHITEIIDYYIDINEEYETDLKPVEILSMTFWPEDYDPINVPDNVIQKYNKTLRN